MNGDSNKTISNENLIIVLHGFGDSKKPFLDLPKKWTLEKTTFLFLDGNDKLPQELTGSDNSYSWFEYFDLNTGDWYPDDSEKARNNCKKALFSKLSRYWSRCRTIPGGRPSRFSFSGSRKGVHMR